MPNYFSSTNCRASGNAMVYGPVLGSPAYFVWGELALNGHVVDSFSYVSGEPQPLSLPLQARFDSTYFGDGGTIVVSLEALDNFGRLNSASNSAPLKNKAKLFQLEEFSDSILENAIPPVNSALMSVDYATTVHNDSSWTHQTIRDELSDCAILFIASHGNKLSHLLGNLMPLYADFYRPYREFVNGSGLPPFNSSGSPPTALMHLLACWCGSPSPVWPVENRFAQVMYPYDTAYNEGTANQALIAYDGEIVIDEMALLASRFTNYAVNETWTINEARDRTLYANILFEDIHIRVKVGGELKVMNVREEMRLWGDFHTRIKWLYTGSIVEAPSLWHSN